VELYLAIFALKPLPLIFLKEKKFANLNPILILNKNVDKTYIISIINKIGFRRHIPIIITEMRGRIKDINPPEYNDTKITVSCKSFMEIGRNIKGFSKSYSCSSHE